MYLHVDLCCGLGGWQQPFKEDPQWTSVGLDIRKGVSPDVLADVRQLPLKDCKPTLITASPPCTQFTTAKPEPMAERQLDWSVWDACWDAIQALGPTWYVVENVRGMVYWQGKADKIVGRDYFLWGHFPPFDVVDVSGKSRELRYQPDELAKIPYDLALSLKTAVETWSSSH